MLITKSEFFKNLWTSDFKENKANSIFIGEDTLEGFEKLLELLKFPDLLTEENCLECLDLTNKYLIADLQKQILEHTLNHFLAYSKEKKFLEDFISFLQLRPNLKELIQSKWDELFKQVPLQEDQLKALDALVTFMKRLEIKITTLNLPYGTNAQWLDKLSGLSGVQKIKVIESLSGRRGENFLKKLGQFPQLTSLNLSQAILSHDLYPLLTDLKELQELILPYTLKLDNADLELLTKLQNLRKLGLTFQTSQFSEEGYVHLQKLPRLADLKIGLGSHMYSDQEFATLCLIPSLEKLTLISTTYHRITDTGLKNILNAKHLRELNINGLNPENSVQGLEVLAEHGTLEKFHGITNGYYSEPLREFETNHPRPQIIWHE